MTSLKTCLFAAMLAFTLSSCNDDDDDHNANDVENVHVRTPSEAGCFDVNAPHSDPERSDVDAVP